MVLVFVLAKPFPDGLPRSVVILDLILSCALLGGARLARRSLAERPARRAARLREVLVVGAGSGGQMVVRELKLNPNLGARAIGFLDDDPRKRGMRTEGLKVIGTTDEIGPICDRLAPDEVVIAIPSARGAAREGRRRVSRSRDSGANAPDRVRAASRRRAAHAPAARGPGGGRPRTRSGGHGARAGRRLPRGQAGAGDRRGGLDRRRALPPDRACGRGCW